MVKYLHGSALFVGIVAALYGTKNIYPDKEYQAFVKTYTESKDRRFQVKKQKREAAKAKKS